MPPLLEGLHFSVNMFPNTLSIYSTIYTSTTSTSSGWSTSYIRSSLHSFCQRWFSCSCMRRSYFCSCIGCGNISAACCIWTAGIVHGRWLQLCGPHMAKSGTVGCFNTPTYCFLQAGSNFWYLSNIGRQNLGNSVNGGPKFNYCNWQ